MGQITATRNLVATKVVRHAGQWQRWHFDNSNFSVSTLFWITYFERKDKSLYWIVVTHWGRATHICVGKLTIIASDNGLAPGRRQAIIWTNAGILLIRTLGTNFSEILIAIETFSFKKMLLKLSSVKWRPFRLGLNVLTDPRHFHAKLNIPV